MVGVADLVFLDYYTLRCVVIFKELDKWCK